MAKHDNDWKKRLGMVYSTNPDTEYEYDHVEESDTIQPSEQRLRIRLDRKHRKGKVVSLISGFVGKSSDLQVLATHLKKKCGTGGSATDGDIVIQGDFRPRLKELLEKEGYHVIVQ